MYNGISKSSLVLVENISTAPLKAQNDSGSFIFFFVILYNRTNRLTLVGKQIQMVKKNISGMCVVVVV